MLYSARGDRDAIDKAKIVIGTPYQTEAPIFSTGMNWFMDKSFSKQFIIGGIVFALGFLSPLLIPLVLMLPLPAAWKTVLATELAFGIPEIMAFIAVVIMGREGFQDLKRMLWGFLKRAAPPDRVGRVRYRIGLVMFTLPLLFAWLGPYLEHWMPDRGVHNPFLLVCSDFLFMCSLFVLGGQFWEKLRALFIWQASNKIPPK